MKQKKYGKCSICGKEAALSVDHIPPKCCGNKSDTYYFQYALEFLVEGERCKLRHSQNGLTFVNICNNCNNAMGKYDIHLQGFRNLVLSCINKTPCSDKFVLEKVCKSVIGHFLAASSYDSCIFSQAMRKYYLDDDKTIYDVYSLFCTYYPYKNRIFSLNNYVTFSLNNYVTLNSDDDNVPNGMISSLNFYPFVFIFCKKQNNRILTDLFEICKNGCSMFEIRMDDWKNKAPTWPAVVDYSHGVLASAAISDSKYKVK